MSRSDTRQDGGPAGAVDLQAFLPCFPGLTAEGKAPVRAEAQGLDPYPSCLNQSFDQLDLPGAPIQAGNPLIGIVDRDLQKIKACFPDSNQFILPGHGFRQSLFT